MSKFIEMVLYAVVFIYMPPNFKDSLTSAFRIDPPRLVVNTPIFAYKWLLVPSPLRTNSFPLTGDFRKLRDTFYAGNGNVLTKYELFHVLGQ